MLEQGSIFGIRCAHPRKSQQGEERKLKKVAIIMGSDSDLPLAKKAADKLKALGVAHVVRVISAHRTPDEAIAFAQGAADEGIGAIITIAGKAAHLGGVIASRTTLPVIGIPCKGSDLGGLDALLSTVQMPPGVPVASMAIDGAVNAAIFACQILAIGDRELAARLEADRQEMRKIVQEKDKAIGEELSYGD